MREAIRELLEVEEKARRIVRDGEAEADRLRREARREADAFQEKARADAASRAAERIDGAARQACAEKERRLEDARGGIETEARISDDVRRCLVEKVASRILGADGD